MRGCRFCVTGDLTARLFMPLYASEADGETIIDHYAFEVGVTYRYRLGAD